MEYWEREELMTLTDEFTEALNKLTPDFEKAKKLLAQGVDINATDSWGESIINDLLLSVAFSSSWDENGNIRTQNVPLIPIIDFFIENGWSTVLHGLPCIAALVHTTGDDQMFYAAKHLLEYPLSEKAEDYEEALEAIGMEESYQRCCVEGDLRHIGENLYCAMYEAVAEKMNGKPFDGIHPFSRAIGKKIDRIVYFADKNNLVQTERGTEYTEDFGFVCGNEVITVTSDVNVLMMNDRISEKPQTYVPTAFGDGVIGATVTDITFEHRNIKKGTTNYGQPTVILKLDSGKELRFTHNFGETTDDTVQARFTICK